MYGAHAAAKRRKEKKKHHHEEEMANYEGDNLDKYEFKIVRASTRRFQRPEIFQQLLNEEAQAGWELLEKLDDRRVRFKRNKDERRKDAMRPAEIDLYRTQFGSAFERPTFTLMLGIALTALLGGVLFFTDGQSGSLDGASDFPLTMILVVFLTIFLAIRAVKNR